MADTGDKEYVRLPGRGLRRSGLISIARTYSSLWLAEDHLLSVDSDYFHENYRRFYYRDIQALIMRRTNRWAIWNAVLGGLGALFGLLAMIPESDAGIITLAIVAGVFLFFFLVNLLLGPTCACQLRTAVQAEDLPSLRRVRTARKALARLKTKIESAQGPLPPEEVAARLREIPASHPETEPQPARRPPAAGSFVPALPRLPYTSNMHQLLVVLFLAETARAGANFFFQHVAMTFLFLLLLLAIAVTVVMTLVRQQNKAVPAGIRRWTWGCLSYLILVAFLAYFHLIFASALHESVGQWQVLIIYSQYNPFESGWIMANHGTLFGGACLLALTGFLVMKHHPAPPETLPQQENGNARPPTLPQP